MRTDDKKLFDLIKDTYPQNPRTEFVLITENKLKQKARKLNRTKKINQFSFASSGVVLFLIAVSWLFAFNGKTMLTNSLSSFREDSIISSVSKQEPLIFIYHSHNYESFMPEISVNDPDEAWHDTKNITLVGERLVKALQERGINSIQDKTNISGVLKENNLTSNKSYTVSRTSLKSALDSNEGIKMVFDIHRDASKRVATTTNIDGKDYARMLFVISRSSARYEENRKFAERLHNKIEEQYPGLSRGVVIQSNVDPTKQSNYNQDLVNNSVLLEIGGVENTLEEGYRTVDILAEVVDEILGN